MDKATQNWMMAGDPAIRWQVQRDLLGRAASTWTRERARIAHHGWGAALLDLQDEDGGWSGAVYSPKWTSTHYTLLQLVRMGLPPRHPAGRRGMERLLAAARFQHGAVNLAKTVANPDDCVNGMVLTMGSYFATQPPVLDGITEWLIERQMPDGGWNCELGRGPTHGSFHTTISVLEGLDAHRSDGLGQSPAVRAAVTAGREFLLEHRLYRSHHTGEIAHRSFTLFSFPPRWHYDVLRALDYFAYVRATPDPRFQDAIDLLVNKRTDDGRWVLQNPHPGRLHFRMEQAGRPSRWNTLRALRVLTWWNE